jgi:hypothetical protein
MAMPRSPHRHVLPLIPALAGALLATCAAAQVCELRAGSRPPAVVELYTSEGCSSCPPADRWLSTLKAQDGVLALSFHVNYWNHLGWRDPFATPETTARQYRLKEALGGKYVYTPQVVLNGKDHRDWNGQTARELTPLPAAAAPGLRLSRQGNQVTAQVAASAAPAMLAGYWAVLQDGLVSKVTRGENAGENLKHDHVVSLYQPVEPWPAGQAHTTHLTLPAGGNPRVAFVVTHPGLTRPVQALVLQCPS